MQPLNNLIRIIFYIYSFMYIIIAFYITIYSFVLFNAAPILLIIDACLFTNIIFFLRKLISIKLKYFQLTFSNNIMDYLCYLIVNITFIFSYILIDMKIIESKDINIFFNFISNMDYLMYIKDNITTIVLIFILNLPLIISFTFRKNNY